MEHSLKLPYLPHLSLLSMHKYRWSLRKVVFPSLELLFCLGWRLVFIWWLHRVAWSLHSLIRYQWDCPNHFSQAPHFWMQLKTNTSHPAAHSGKQLLTETCCCICLSYVLHSISISSTFPAKEKAGVFAFSISKEKGLLDLKRPP